MAIWLDEPPELRTGQRPVIQVNGRRLCDIVDDAWRALNAANRSPFLFLHDGRLVHRAVLGDGQFWLRRVGTVGLFGILIRVADWMRATQKGLVPSKPPRAVVAAMRRAPDPALPVLHEPYRGHSPRTW